MNRDADLRAALLAWFDAVARDLPWRREEPRASGGSGRPPYAVWLSEIMLQQTRVDTVIPYFERFVHRYPDVRALAQAELDDVLHLWSGLGYYRRARTLHATAREIVTTYGGDFPSTAEGLRALGGVGAYTAGAIASLAFGERTPLVDGNVARVLSRLEGIDEPVKKPATVKKLWALAERLVDPDRPGAWNESLMELGALVCTPREPRCGACPVASFCVAKATGRQNELPVLEEKKATPTIPCVAALVREPGGARLLYARRREGGLFGGLWEPPLVELAKISTSAARAALKAQGFDLGRAAFTELGEVTHVLSHRRMEVAVVAVAPRAFTLPLAPSEPYERATWLTPGAEGVGVSTLARKILGLQKH